MASESTPLILLVPGAFGKPAGFSSLVPYLHEAGFSTHLTNHLSSDPEDAAAASCLVDIAYLRNEVLLPLLQQGKKVIILAHSYGGVVGGGAAKDLDVQTREARGEPGGVVGFIYVIGNITMEGETLIESMGGVYPPFVKRGTPSKGLAIIEPAMDILYNDMDPALAPELKDNMTPHALNAFETKAPAPAWADRCFDGKRAYVRTLDDACNPLFLQNIWLEKSKVKWDIVDMKTGHMPFVSRPKELAAHIVKFAKDFSAS